MMRQPRYLILALLSCAAVLPLTALVQPDDSPMLSKIFQHPDLRVAARYAHASEGQANGLGGPMRQPALGVPPEAAYLDVRTGRWATLMPSKPLLPGSGVGNNLTWESRQMDGPPSYAAQQEMAWEAFIGYLRDHQSELRIDLGELADPNIAIRDDGALVQIHAPRRVNGVPVRDSYLTGVIRHGNLTLFGARNWGDVATAAQPALTVDAAIATASTHLEPFVASRWHKASLAFVPAAPGDAMTYRLVWALRPVFDDGLGTWEALVDAHNGELLSFADLNQYASAREVEGGVYPQSNDGIGPEGTEQPDYAMPFTDVANAGDDFFTDSGGNLLACVDGDITTTLSGQFVSMFDNCGAISATTGGDILDFGTSGGDDCTTPGLGGAGNTHSSRTGMYELNRIIEMARGHLPDNVWLQGQLTANMNINQFCNAFWGGGSVNFYRSGGGCGNTGELAGVFDHEWGHGMDDNDLNPAISSPGEGIADAYAFLRLDTSCMGRGFNQGANCGGYGDPCTSCDGVRDIDWANRLSGAPHDVAWIDVNCGPGNTNGPCGGSVHCESAAYSEAVYDLVERDLPSVYGMDHNTAHEVGAYLTYQGAGPVGNWFDCITTGFAGCNADGGYLNFLAADDDNGDLLDGTPHMTAIFDAFDRHGTACATPTVQDSGCAGGPTTAPVVTGTALDRGARLTWGAVAGASKYKVYRTEGVFGCDLGKIPVGETTGTEFIDDGLKNGTEAFYIVAAIGPDDSCFGPASSCTSVTPAAGANVALVESASGDFAFLSGDGDIFLDNCEQGSVDVTMANIGTGTLTNVRIVDVVGVNHPETEVVSALPLTVDASMTECETVLASVDIQAGGLSLGDVLDLRIDYTSDEISPDVKSTVVRVNVTSTEGDFQNFASRTFTYEPDIEDWLVASGTFDRTSTGAGSGGDGTDNYVASSGFTGNQCDNIRSPVLSLATDSTMTLWSNFNIEDDTGSGWYDRANVGIYDVAAGTRTVKTPSSGRAYNASGNAASDFCTNNQPGWAGSMQTWATSDFDATALGSAAIAGDLVQLDVAYGTDPLSHPEGFWFDEVTVTNVDVQVADGQSDVCAPPTLIFTDGFESGDTSAWTATIP